MRVVHIAERIAPFWPDSAGACAVAELPSGQQSTEDELMVIGAAPVTSVRDFSSPQQFARRLEPLVVEDGAGEYEAVVLESTLAGTAIRLFLLVIPPDRGIAGFGAAALGLLGSLPEPPELVHLHGETGMDLDAAREQLGGPAVVQSVYGAVGSHGLAAAVQDADEVVAPCSDLAAADLADEGSDLAEALAEHTHLRVVRHGIDLQRWDPARDKALAAGFDTESLQGKAECKKALQVQAGLAPREDVVLMAVWSAGGPRSGLGLVAAHLEEILALDVQLVVLRSGSEDDPEALAALKGSQVWQTDVGNGSMLRRVLAGCDVVLLPDQTALLGQRALISARYGLVPVARSVNAYRDRLVEYDGLSNTGGAFLFGEPADEELMVALKRMRRVFGSPEVWPGMLRANGAMDMGWSRTAAQLHDIYLKAIAK
jgi:hypothetical protein